MALLRERGEEIEVVETERARATVYRLGRDILVTVASGHAALAHIELLIRRSERLIAEVGRISIVHDWFAVDGYKPEVRQRMTPWALKTRDQHRAIHIGTASRLVRMGVTTVQLFSHAPIQAHADLPSLERALRELAAQGARAGSSRETGMK